MRRREFLTSGPALLYLMASGAAEPSRPWRVAFVAAGIVGEEADTLRDTLHRFGYDVGKNLVLEVREARGNFGLLPEIMKEVVSLKPDVIVAEATPAIAAAKRATSTIPIVMAPATDPIGSGFVQSFARPGGNITGLANLFGDQTAKALDFLHLVLPQAKKIGVLTSNNPTHPALFEAANAGASNIGISAERFIARTPDELEATFEAIKSANCEAVYALADPVRPAIPELALKFGLPVMYQLDWYVEKLGGLMSYGAETLGFFRRAADYVDRILKGGNPAEMPVEQPTTFRFVVNLRTAKKLGLTIPESVLAQADEVME
jgi:putative tryptophan/tyrosine transport system substrate-binding protein